MAAKKLFVLLSLFFLTCFILPLGFAQEQAQEQAVAQTENTPESPAAGETSVEPEIQWIWGDVVSINPVTKELLVKYIDYDTDSEKEISISIAEKTTYDNAQSLEEIKIGDSVSIDYISAGAKNLAKNISLERQDVAEESPAPETPPEE